MQQAEAESATCYWRSESTSCGMFLRASPEDNLVVSNQLGGFFNLWGLSVLGVRIIMMQNPVFVVGSGTGVYFSPVYYTKCREFV